MNAMPRRSKIMAVLSIRLNKFRERFYAVAEEQITEMKGDPGKVALGCTLGLCVNFIPTLGLGFILAFVLAALFGGNRVSATATSLLTGPLIPVKYALNLLVGGVIYAHGTDTDLVEMVVRQYALIFRLGGIREKMLSFLDFFGTTFIIGAAVNVIVLGTIFYFAVRALLRKKFGQ